MLESIDLPQHPDRLSALKQWLNVNPAVNLIQVIAGFKIVFVLIAFLFFRNAEEEAWRFLAISLLIAGLWMAARWVARKYDENLTSGALSLWIGISFCLIQMITIISSGSFPRLLYVIPTIIAVFHMEQRSAFVVSIGTICWLVLNFILFPIEASANTIEPLILLVIIYLTGHALVYTLLQERRARQREQLLLHELQESNEQLTRYAAEVTQLATMRERNRIAREIHDSLGHYLTIVGVQLEKAILLDTVASAEAGEAVRAAKQLADQALAEVRHSVGTLREAEEPFTLHAALQTLVMNAEQSGLTVDFRWRGDETGFAKQQLMTLFRAVQEGVTNVQKHAHAKQVWLDIALDAEGAIIKFEDDGIGFDPQSVKQGSYGLQGLRERVELVDGKLTLGRSLAGGAQLVVQLPKKEQL
ncbi:MAG: sensor histidine kinase [Chloroflexota bacterium]